MKKIAILSTDGFEYSELTVPQQFFRDTGYTVDVISPKSDSIVAASNKGDVAVDIPLDEANPEEYEALILPGGLVNPDILRTITPAVEFLKHFVESEKPVAAICHGPWTLIEADAVRGKRVTSWTSLKTDLINAGATWVDEAVVVDGNIVTSRKPSDLPSFNEGLMSLLSDDSQ